MLRQSAFRLKAEQRKAYDQYTTSKIMIRGSEG